MSTAGDVSQVPARIQNVEELEDLLSRPTPEVVDLMRRIEGDILFLGIGGKIGPSLARMARRACDAAGVKRRIFGVARFTSTDMADRLAAQGIEPVRADLLDRRQFDALPEVPNVFYLAAMKFGATGQEARTWAMNTYLPGMVCEKYHASRIVAYSTGNVYGLVPVSGTGSKETDALRPDADYAMSCAGRERIITYFSQALNIPSCLLRLNYATEPRYGVIVDVADQILAGRPVDVTMGYFNAVWQGDSNAMTLRALEHVAVPTRVFNIAGPDKLRVRDVAQELGRLMNKPVTIAGQEASDALLSDGRHAYEFIGRPQLPISQLLAWIADWKLHGGASLNKPTHFQTRDGKF